MAKKKKKNYLLSLLILVLIACWIYVEESRTEAEEVACIAASQTAESGVAVSSKLDSAAYELPRLGEPRAEQVIEHLAYTVSYNADWHLPNWVAYQLTATETEGDLTRTDKFLPDPMVEGDPVVTKDYSGSGYDRGHMAPAADMRWSEQAMKESFYMTNMCPQNHNNNAGDWKDLEELGRDLAIRYGAIYICCGPIVTDPTHTIGTVRKIVVPSAFYKVLLRQKQDGTWTSVGFVMPNSAGNQPLMTYMHSVDEVEQMTGIDFFCQLPDSVQSVTECDFTVADWTVK